MSKVISGDEMIVEDIKIKGGENVEIIEVEYGATISHNYNNYRVSLRAKIDSKEEDVEAVIDALRRMVKAELEKDIIENDLGIKDRIDQIRAMLNSIDNEISEIRNSKDFRDIKEIASLKRKIRAIENHKRELERKLAMLLDGDDSKVDSEIAQEQAITDMQLEYEDECKNVYKR